MRCCLFGRQPAVGWVNVLPEDEGGAFLRNGGVFLLEYTVPHLLAWETSVTLLVVNSVKVERQCLCIYTLVMWFFYTCWIWVLNLVFVICHVSFTILFGKFAEDDRKFHFPSRRSCLIVLRIMVFLCICSLNEVMLVRGFRFVTSVTVKT